MDYQNIIVEKKERIAKITLNRPERMNAMNSQSYDEIKAACEDIEKDDSIGIVIITGAGRAFCAGLDLKEMESNPDFTHQWAVRMHESAENPYPRWPTDVLSKPVIAAVNGHCYTGGLELALACDMIIASENAIFCDTHARYGMIPGSGGTQRLPRFVGRVKAKELLFTCEPISAQEAERIGLINKVVPADKLDEVADELAKKILKNNQDAVRTIKLVINEPIKLELANGMKIEYDHRTE